MPKPRTHSKITRGYARTEHDALRLQAKGVPESAIYRADKGQRLDRFRLRKGEYLGVVDGLCAFGEGKKTIGDAVKLIHSWGAIIIDAETEMESRQDGVEMFRIALGPKIGKLRARELQALAAQARKDDGRMPKRQALAIWRDPRYKTIQEALFVMGWPQATAYAVLGPRFKVIERPM
jgi:hypothetical protein